MPAHRTMAGKSRNDRPASQQGTLRTGQFMFYIAISMMCGLLLGSLHRGGGALSPFAPRPGASEGGARPSQMFAHAGNADGGRAGFVDAPEGGGAKLQHVTDLDASIVSQNVVDGPVVEIDTGTNAHKTTVAAIVDAGGRATAGSSAAAGVGGGAQQPRQNFYQQYQSSPPDAPLPSNPMERTSPPSLCPDGRTWGYSDWSALRSAIVEANDLSAQSFVRLSQFYAAYDQYERNPGVYEAPVPPETPTFDPFVICPGATLRTPRHARRMTIDVNAEDVTIECDSCLVDVGGTHLSFGAKARNVVIRGLTFTGATSSSLIFHHHGAVVAFEDCFWMGNSGAGNNVGAVADLNSTSSVSFYRCEISDTKQVTRGAGGQLHQSSLTIRN